MEGANHQVQVISDNQNLELFQTTKVLNRRQARWEQELAGYDFKIFFRPGKHNGKADYLSRRPEYRLEKGGDRKPETILKQDNISEEPSDYSIPLRIKYVPYPRSNGGRISLRRSEVLLILTSSTNQVCVPSALTQVIPIILNHPNT